jgi:hypothetical protein
LRHVSLTPQVIAKQLENDAHSCYANGTFKLKNVHAPHGYIVRIPVLKN